VGSCAESLAVAAASFVSVPIVSALLLLATPPPAAAAEAIPVIAARATTACFSARVRVNGTLQPRAEALVGPEGEGFRVVQLLVAEGDRVTAGQVLARLSRQIGEGGAAQASQSGVAVRAPVAGTVIRSSGVIGAFASARAGPLFRIATDGDIDLVAEVAGIHVTKLAPGQPARIELEDNRQLAGKVRTVPAAVDPQTQLGRTRIAVENDPSLKVGAFARAIIDATRSCGVAVPRAAVLYRTEGTSVQVIHNSMVATRLVRVGILSGALAEIREGISEGDVVVANAGTSLRDGDMVRPSFAEDAGQVGAR
jgi:HlyD family secretion protein